jgi:two-component system, NarL family, nitrate/nitrite response regulator NarL
VEGSLRIAVFTQVRLLGEAIALSLAARDAQMEVVLARHLEELRGLTAEHPALELVIVDTTQSVDLEAIRAFHRDHRELPLLALGLREREAEIVAHGSAGFACYLRREDGLDRLCAIVEDAVMGRLNCSPEIAAAIMRGFFRKLRLSESTVKYHVHSILGKFGLSTRGQLMRDMRRDAWAQEGPARSHG